MGIDNTYMQSRNHFLTFTLLLVAWTYSSGHYPVTTMDIYLSVLFLPFWQIDGDGGACSMPSHHASKTAHWSTHQQLPGQIRTARDSILWCNVKIQEH
jgi:hypothetical protein